MENRGTTMQLQKNRIVWIATGMILILLLVLLFVNLFKTEQSDIDPYALLMEYETKASEDWYGGSFVDEANRILHVNVVDQSGSAIRELKQYSKVVYHAVTFSKTQLEDAQEALRPYWEELGIFSTAIDILHNAVSVDTTQTEDDMYPLLERYFDDVSIFHIVQTDNPPVFL